MAVLKDNTKHKLIESVFRNHYSEYLSFTWKISSDYQTAKDIVQDVFVFAINNPEVIPATVEDLRKYIFKSVKNKAIDNIRHLNSRSKNSLMLSESLIFSGTIDLEHDETVIKAIKDCVEKLSNNQRRVINLKFSKNLSYDKIANILGVNTSTVHTHIKRSYNLLRLCLGKNTDNNVP